MGVPYNRMRRMERQLEPFWMDYNDAATAVTPINFGVAETVTLTNDGLGPFTSKQFNQGIELWNSDTNQFDFSSLEIGDVVQMRIDLTPTFNTNNIDIFLGINLGVGAFPYSLNLAHSYYKTADTYNNVIVNALVYMGDENTLNNPAELTFYSDKDGSVVVNGWFVTVT